MANSIKFMNEGFNKYNNIKPSFEDCLYEAMKTLTERQQEWSDEDKQDNELLWSIFDKRQARSNAKLTPEEQAVLKKYNIQEPYNDLPGRHGADRRVIAKTSPYTNLFDRDVQSYGSNTKYNTKVNLADKARKQSPRYMAKKDIDAYNAKHQQNMINMKNALWDRDYSARQLANIDSDRDKRIAELQAKIDKEKSTAEWLKRHHQDSLQGAQSEIGKLLKRESLEDEEERKKAIPLYARHLGGLPHDFVYTNGGYYGLVKNLRDNQRVYGTWVGFEHQGNRTDAKLRNLLPQVVKNIAVPAMAKYLNVPETEIKVQDDRNLTDMFRLYYIGEVNNESLKNEAYSDKYGGNKEDYLADITEVIEALDNVSHNIATLGVGGLVEEFIYKLEILKKSAMNESVNTRTLLKK